MADKKISELTAVSSLNNGDLVEVSQVNALAPSGYTSLKATMADLGSKVNTDIDYTTDLADFENKTTLGAIKETAKGKNIADEYDDTQTYDKGDVVIYKNTLYICTTNNTTGTWDATKWTATTIDNVIGDLSQLTTSDKSSLVGAVNEVNASSTASVTPISVTVNSVINNNITKIGKVVHIEYSFSLKAMSGTIQNKTWGTIPEGYRPTSEVIFNAYYISDYASNVETKAILISASSSGSITTPNNGANGTLSNPTNNSRIYMSATYIVS